MTVRRFLRNGGDGALILLFVSGASLWIWPNVLTVILLIVALSFVGLATQNGGG